MKLALAALILLATASASAQDAWYDTWATEPISRPPVYNSCRMEMAWIPIHVQYFVAWNGYGHVTYKRTWWQYGQKVVCRDIQAYR